MKIKSIKASIKGRDIALEFDENPVALVVGENGTGKTAVANAINLAFRGFEPSVAKSSDARNNNAHRKLAGPDGVLSVSLMTDDGEFTYLLDAKGRTHEGRELDTIETQLLDPSRFFEAGPKDRINYVLSIASSLPSIESLREELDTSISLISPAVEPADGFEFLEAVMTHQRERLKARKNELKSVSAIVEETKLRIIELESKGITRAAVKAAAANIEKIGELRGKASALKGRVRKAPVRVDVPADPGPRDDLAAHVERQAAIYEEMRERATELRAAAKKAEAELAYVSQGACPTCKRALDVTPDDIQEARRDSELAAAYLSRHLEEMKHHNEDTENARAKLRELDRHLAERKEAERAAADYEESLREHEESLAELEAAEAELAAFLETHSTEELMSVSSDASALTSAREALARDEETITLLNDEISERTRIGIEAKSKKVSLMRDALEEAIDVGAESMGRVLPWFRMSVDENGGLGYWRDDAWIPSDTWSGAELAAAYAAMSISLAVRSEGIALVVIDEFARFSPATQERLISELNELAEEGSIEQAILLTPGVVCRGQFQSIELS